MRFYVPCRIGLFFMALGCLHLGAQDVSAVPGAAATQGKIIVGVTYDSRGKVMMCEIARSNAPLEIETSVVQYIKANWGGEFFAGSEILVPLNFDGVPAPQGWLSEMATPPNFFPYDGKEYHLTLRVAFGADGWAQQCLPVEPSGLDLVDRQIVAWTRVHWHSAQYAGKTVDAPFIFRREQTKPATVALKPKPRPASEPVAIPATRAQ